VAAPFVRLSSACCVETALETTCATIGRFCVIPIVCANCDCGVEPTAPVCICGVSNPLGALNDGAGVDGVEGDEPPLPPPPPADPLPPDDRIAFARDAADNTAAT